MTIVGIDPATRCGWAVLTPVRVDAGTWVLGRPGSDTGGRVAELADCLAELLTRHEPDVVAYETPTPRMHGKGAMLQYGLCARILEMCHRRNIHAVGIAPTTAKKLVAGHGRADKAEIQRAVLRHCDGLDPLKLDNNAFDAIAIAMAAERREEK